MDRRTEVQVFIQIAERASITKAAEALNMLVSTTSLNLQALEDRLKIRFILRMTRQLCSSSISSTKRRPNGIGSTAILRARSHKPGNDDVYTDRAGSAEPAAVVEHANLRGPGYFH